MSLINRIWQFGGTVAGLALLALILNQIYQQSPSGGNNFLSQIMSTTLVLLVPSGAFFLLYVLYVQD